MFKYNPRNHCWPAVWKSVTAISTYTLLLTAIETLIVYEIVKAFDLSENASLLISSAFGLINSIILRRYVCVISLRNYRNPRFVCHWFIVLISCIYITIGNNIEHAVREMHRSKTLCDISFNTNEYYYIEHPVNLDTVNSIQDFTYEEQHITHQTSQHHFCGYYIAPFCERKSVFYAVKYERKYPTNKYSRSESKQMFLQELQDSINRIKHFPNNHLYQCINPQHIDYYDFYTRITYSSFSQKDSYKSIENILIAVKDDRTPRWYDDLLLYTSWLVFFILILIFCFGTAVTEEPFR